MELEFVPKSEFDRILTISDPVRRAELFATAGRINALYTIERAGSGHIGTSFSCLDILSWIFTREFPRWQAGGGTEEPIYFSSKGHDAPALYAVMTALGRLDFDLIHKLRRIDGLPGHPDVGTPGIPTNTGSLGMGVSKAKGFALARRLQGRTVPIFVLTGDGELQEGQFWESLQGAVNRGLGEITAIVDHNKLQSDTFVSDVSDLGDLEAKFRAFGWHVRRGDGNDVGFLQGVFDEFATIVDRPKVLIADTIKGKGVSIMEPAAMVAAGEWRYRYHSGAPSLPDYEVGLKELVARAQDQAAAAGLGRLTTERVSLPDRVAPQNVDRLVNAYSDALVDQARANDRIVALDGDLILDTGLIPFREAFPNRFFECGIAEQDMVSMAGAMAREGLLPVAHSFACFMTPRANEQIFNNATEQTKVVYVGSLAGVVPGGPGHSHQMIRDLAIMASQPGLIAIEPACEAEVKAAVDFCFNQTDRSCYLRLVSIPVEIPFSLPADYRLELGRGTRLRDGADGVIFSYSPVTLSQAYLAAEKLRGEGLDLAVVNLPWLADVDRDWLRETVGGRDLVVAVDNHYRIGGLGDRLGSELAGIGFGGRYLRFAVDEVPACGTNDEVLAYHRLDAASLAADIAATLARRAVR